MQFPEYHRVVVFSLSVGLEAERRRHFEIDSESGDIRTTGLFTQNPEPFYTLRVKAKDSGASPLEDTAVIHVQVQSVLHFLQVLLDMLMYLFLGALGKYEKRVITFRFTTRYSNKENIRKIEDKNVKLLLLWWLNH